MKKRIMAFILSLMLFVPSAAVAATETRETEKTVQETVYTYLTEELGLSPAAASGIMGNIMIECAFDPSALAMDVNGLYSFGLMMWNGSRYESLKKWCADLGLEPEDPEGQLSYLKWELENTEKAAYRAMLDIPNTIEGACRAAIVWAQDFERCTRTSFGLRIFHAINTYWPKLAGGTVSNTPGIYGYYYNVPDNLKYGEPLTMYGAVVSYSSNLKSLTVGVYTEDGTLVTGKTVDQSNLVGNIGIVDRFIVFNKVPKGEYYYTITAVNDAGEYMVERHAFTVSDEPTSATLIKESEGGVICENGASCPGLAFSDMPPATSWQHSGIDYVLNEGLFAGKPGGIFAPDEDMNRAMFVTVLRRLYDRYELGGTSDTDESSEDDFSSVTEPASDSESDTAASEEPMSDTEEISDTEAASDTAESTDNLSADSSGSDTEEPVELVFDDVTEDAWYFDAVMWAYGEELVNGKAEGVFAPMAPLTRAELATLLYRFAEKYGLDTSARAEFEGFADAEDIQEWASGALSWAVAEGLVNGSENRDGLFIDPQGHATRAQVAAITERFAAFVERS